MAKNIFKKHAIYKKTKISNIKALKNLPNTDIKPLNKNRYAHHFHAGNKNVGEVDPKFYLKTWPKVNHSQFRHWFRAQFG